MTTLAACRISAVGTTPSWSSAFFDSRLCNNVKLSCRGNAHTWAGTVKSDSVSVTRAVLDKTASGSTGASSGEPRDLARQALERLFSQALRTGESKHESEANPESAIGDLQADLKSTVAALKAKEAQLRAAEDVLQQDQWDVQNAKSSLYQQEQDLELYRTSHVQMEVELGIARRKVREQAGELEHAKATIERKEGELRRASDALSLKQSELVKSQSMLLAKDEALLTAASELKSISLRLQRADELAIKGAVEIKQLKKAIYDKELTLVKLQKEKRFKDEQLERAEVDIEKHAMAWLKAQEEVSNLEKELATVKVEANVDLLQAKALLADVQGELEESLSSVEKFRFSLEEQDLVLARQEEFLSMQLALFEDRENSLEAIQVELEKERSALEAAEEDQATHEEHLLESKRLVDTLQAHVQKGKAELQESHFQINALKIDLQQKDSLLSDIHLALQLKEAELVAAKLEAHLLKSHVASMQINLKNKTRELQDAHNTVDELWEEASEIRAIMQSQEVQLLRSTNLLQEKETELMIMRMDLDDSRTQLSEATSIVEQITALSSALVNSAKEGMASRYDEESVLMQTNVELFTANRKLLERELQLQRYQEIAMKNVIRREELEAELVAVKDCLREKDSELHAAYEALAEKEHEVQSLLSRWDMREVELDLLREEVMAEAKGLKSLHNILQTHKAITGKKLGASAVEMLQLEVANPEVERTLVALQRLADLSQEILERNGESVEASVQEFSSTHEGDQDKALVDTAAWARDPAVVNNIRGKLDERDAELELTKTALEGLTRLTEKLVLEAGIVLVEDNTCLQVGAGTPC